MAVIQVTSREFRDNQAAMFTLADKGEQIIIRRGKKQAYVLTPVSREDYSIILSAEAEKRIEQSREQYRNGETTVCATKEELDKFLESL